MLKNLAVVSTLAMAPMAAFAGDVILTVTNGGSATTFDLAALEAMERVEFETSTTWTEGVQAFAGVSLEHFLEEIGVEGETIKATAINDYAVEIPVSDAVQDGPIIAYMRNGEPMSVRDKGPLWIVYPYDSNVEYQSEVIYSRSIWQLDRIDIIE